MDMVKKLPVTLVAVAALRLISVLTQKLTQEQIDVIVVKAVGKMPVERQAKMDATITKKADIINEPQSAAQSPGMAIPFGVKFNDHARYDTCFQNGDQKYAGVDGSYNGAFAIGRLGNEGNGGEFQLSKVFKNDNGTIWDINVMIGRWGGEVNLKKTCAGITSVLKSNPNAYIWAGRDFHRRPQQGINNYSWMDHDGQGAGVKNFDIGGVRFDVTIVAATKSCSPEAMEDKANPSRITCTGGSGTDDKGNYTVTSKVHNMEVGPLNLKVYTNYGFGSKAVESDDRLRAWQGAFVLGHTNGGDVNRAIARYSDNSDNSIRNKTDGLTTVYASLEGSHKFTCRAQVGHLLTFHGYNNSTDESDNRKNYGVIVRSMYFWDDVRSTWLEAGYWRVDYDNDGDNHGWKLTLSQNMSIVMGPEFRPMLCFYVTDGKADNDRIARINDTQDETLDDFNLGAMWEAWF